MAGDRRNPSVRGAAATSWQRWVDLVVALAIVIGASTAYYVRTAATDVTAEAEQLWVQLEANQELLHDITRSISKALDTAHLRIEALEARHVLVAKTVESRRSELEYQSVERVHKIRDFAKDSMLRVRGYIEDTTKELTSFIQQQIDGK